MSDRPEGFHRALVGDAEQTIFLEGMTMGETELVKVDFESQGLPHWSLGPELKCPFCGTSDVHLSGEEPPEHVSGEFRLPLQGECGSTMAICIQFHKGTSHIYVLALRDCREKNVRLPISSIIDSD